MDDEKYEIGGSGVKLSSEQILSIWKEAIETQKHFAELSLRMRQIGLAVSGAILAFSAVLLRENDYSNLTIGEVNIPIVSVLPFIAAIVLIAVWRIDIGVYHKMLRGGVEFNENFENIIFGVEYTGLTGTISYFSRYSKPSKSKGGNLYQPDLSGPKESAAEKIRSFYIILIGALCFMGCLGFLVGFEGLAPHE